MKWILFVLGFAALLSPAFDFGPSGPVGAVEAAYDDVLAMEVGASTREYTGIVRTARNQPDGVQYLVVRLSNGATLQLLTEGTTFRDGDRVLCTSSHAGEVNIRSDAV
jgi:hypothetical protein